MGSLWRQTAEVRGWMQRSWIGSSCLCVSPTAVCGFACARSLLFAAFSASIHLHLSFSLCRENGETCLLQMLLHYEIPNKRMNEIITDIKSSTSPNCGNRHILHLLAPCLLIKSKGRTNRSWCFICSSVLSPSCIFLNVVSAEYPKLSSWMDVRTSSSLSVCYPSAQTTTFLLYWFVACLHRHH